LWISQGELPVVGFPSLVLVDGAAYMEITVTEIYDISPDIILELGWMGSNSTDHRSGSWRNFISIFRQNPADASFFSTANESVEFS
jgi:hypothetical protein